MAVVVVVYVYVVVFVCVCVRVCVCMCVCVCVCDHARACVSGTVVAMVTMVTPHVTSKIPRVR